MNNIFGMKKKKKNEFQRCSTEWGIIKCIVATADRFLLINHPSLAWALNFIYFLYHPKLSIASSSNFSRVWLIYVAAHARVIVYPAGINSKCRKIYFAQSTENVDPVFVKSILCEQETSLDLFLFSSFYWRGFIHLDSWDFLEEISEKLFHIFRIILLTSFSFNFGMIRYRFLFLFTLFLVLWFWYL